MFIFNGLDLYNPVGNYTYDAIGSQSVRAHTTGNDRTKLSAAFAANANGQKLPVLIIIPRITDLPNYTPPDNVLLVYKSNIDTNIISDVFIDRIMATHVKRFNLTGATVF
jgi:hypothetical protein